MKISVFGLGYVGSVTAACLAELGHSIIGVDINRDKALTFAEGRPPVLEPGLEASLLSAHVEGRLTGTISVEAAVAESEITIICVGTPSNSNGSLDTSYVERVVNDIGAAMAKKSAYHTVVIRSTILPGTVKDVIIPILENNSEKKVDQDFGLCMVPEFLREGTAVSDFFAPPFTVIGQAGAKSGKIPGIIFSSIDTPIFFTDLKTAEMIKYTCNAFHGLKVGFANEIGRLSKALGVDARQVMEIFSLDTKLNLSAYYLKPGFAFGGSCLPKDLRALAHAMKTRDVSAPILEGVLPSNRVHLIGVQNLLLESGYQRIGFLGLSFKAGTDDLRESPTVELIEFLLGKGRAVTIYDPNVVPGALVGANKAFMQTHLPHLEKLLRGTSAEVVKNSEVVVVCNTNEEFSSAFDGSAKNPRMVVDLVGTLGLESKVGQRYVGICW